MLIEHADLDAVGVDTEAGVKSSSSLLPKLLKLLKRGMGLVSRAAAADVLCRLAYEKGKAEAWKKHADNIFKTCVNISLNDRNSTIRKCSARTAAVIVALNVCDEEAVTTELQSIISTYLLHNPKEVDHSKYSQISVFYSSISEAAVEVMKRKEEYILPLCFVASQHQVEPDDEEMKKCVDAYKEIWEEQTLGTTSGVSKFYLHLLPLIDKCLVSDFWTLKAQAARSLHVISLNMGRLEKDQVKELILQCKKCLKGKIWPDKHYLLKALHKFLMGLDDGDVLDGDDSTGLALDLVKEMCKVEDVEYSMLGVRCMRELMKRCKHRTDDITQPLVQGLFTIWAVGTDKDEDSDGEESRFSKLKQRDESERGRLGRLEESLRLFEEQFPLMSSTTSHPGSLYTDCVKHLLNLVETSAMPLAAKCVQITMDGALRVKYQDMDDLVKLVNSTLAGHTLHADVITILQQTLSLTPEAL